MIGSEGATATPGAAEAGARPLLEVEHLELHFPVGRGSLGRRDREVVKAVDDVSFELRAGETLGLVGESGCGKTTLSRAILRLIEPTGGSLRFDGAEIAHAGSRELAPLRRRMQIVFQDPFSSLNPRRTARQSIAQPLRLHGVDRQAAAARVDELLERVGLAREHGDRYPHEFSGGQRQRVGIARALALGPELVVLDEPVSALDVSVQAQVINLLADLQRELGQAYLFVAHDLGVVRHVSDRVAVMYLGKLVELSAADELYAKPIHPYTEGLLAAIPVPDPRKARARAARIPQGEPPRAADAPAGCVFASRCPRATDICGAVEPPLTRYPGGHLAACHHPLNVSDSDLRAAVRSPASPLSAGE